MKNCPYCKAAGNFYFGTSSRTYDRCPACDLIYKKNRNSYDEVLAHYRNNYFDEFSDDQMSGDRDRLFEKILDLIEEREGIGRVLDIGTGCGFFLMAAKKRGWNVKGIEPSVQSVEIARGQYGLDIYNGPLQAYDEKDEFDVVTFINVLDHLVEPWEGVKKAQLLLRTNGVLFLRFPNGFLHTNLFKILKTIKIGDFMKELFVFHEYCFTPRFIKKLLSDQGFTNIMIYNASLSGIDLIRTSPIFRLVAGLIEMLEKVTDLASGGWFLWGPSVEVIAKKK